MLAKNKPKKRSWQKMLALTTALCVGCAGNLESEILTESESKLTLVRDLAVTTDDPTPPEIYGDTNGDGNIDYYDFLNIYRAWRLAEEAVDPKLDLNGNGTIDINDAYAIYYAIIGRTVVGKYESMFRIGDRFTAYAMNHQAVNIDEPAMVKFGEGSWVSADETTDDGRLIFTIPEDATAGPVVFMINDQWIEKGEAQIKERRLTVEEIFAGRLENLDEYIEKNYIVLDERQQEILESTGGLFGLVPEESLPIKHRSNIVEVPSETYAILSAISGLEPDDRVHEMAKHRLLDMSNDVTFDEVTDYLSYLPKESLNYVEENLVALRGGSDNTAGDDNAGGEYYNDTPSGGDGESNDNNDGENNDGGTEDEPWRDDGSAGKGHVELGGAQVPGEVPCSVSVMAYIQKFEGQNCKYNNTGDQVEPKDGSPAVPVYKYTCEASIADTTQSASVNPILDHWKKYETPFEPDMYSPKVSTARNWYGAQYYTLKPSSSMSVALTNLPKVNSALKLVATYKGNCPVDASVSVEGTSLRQSVKASGIGAASIQSVKELQTNQDASKISLAQSAAYVVSIERRCTSQIIGKPKFRCDPNYDKVDISAALGAGAITSSTTVSSGQSSELDKKTKLAISSENKLGVDVQKTGTDLPGGSATLEHKNGGNSEYDTTVKEAHKGSMVSGYNASKTDTISLKQASLSHTFDEWTLPYIKDRDHTTLITTAEASISAAGTIVNSNSKQWWWADDPEVMPFAGVSGLAEQGIICNMATEEASCSGYKANVTSCVCSLKSWTQHLEREEKMKKAQQEGAAKRQRRAEKPGWGGGASN